MIPRQASSRRALLRTALLATVAALPACSSFDDLFEDVKKPIPGKREAVLASTRGLQVAPGFTNPVNLPPPVLNADWLQSGGNPAHVVGNVKLDDLVHAWRRSIGEGGGYRRKITATPVISAGTVFTMDSDGEVSAFDAASGQRRWDAEMRPKRNRSTNVGGGLAVVGATLYATTGLGEALALDAGTGKIQWRAPLDSPARSAPTVADGRLFVPTLDERLVCLNVADGGKRLWNYQATSVATTALGEPAPAYSDGLVVAGFGSGDLVALRADSGTLAWSDSLASARGRNSLADLSAIRGMPVIMDNTVYVVGLGGLLVAIDLRSGRRLWEREAIGQNTPWIAGDWLFVVTIDQVLACLNRTDGRVRWLSQLPHYENVKRSQDPIYWTGPMLAGQYLLLAGSTGKLLAVNPANGDVLGQQDLPDAVSVGLVAAGGKLFVVTQDSTLSALG